MRESGPSPQFEPEKEARGIALAGEIAGLRSAARTDEDYEAILRKAKELQGLFDPALPEAGLGGEVREQVRLAREILGEENVLGVEAVEHAFGRRLAESEVPAIPFSREDLEEAKRLGQRLVLRIDKAADGTPLTGQKINEICARKMEDGGHGKLLCGDWYESEAFYTEEVSPAGWALVSKEVIPDSTNKNYLEQTDLLVKYLKEEVFKGRVVPEVFQEAIIEFETKKDEIEGLVSSDWEKAAKMLAELKVSALTRQSLIQALYDIALTFDAHRERLLENRYTWTKTRGSGGYLVAVGDFGADGASVDGNGPDDSPSGLGVSFSRSR